MEIVSRGKQRCNKDGTESFIFLSLLISYLKTNKTGFYYVNQNQMVPLKKKK